MIADPTEGELEIRDGGPLSRRASTTHDNSFGELAQLGERLVCNQEVTGSSPVFSTNAFRFPDPLTRVRDRVF